jgi:hypothetical protein
MLAGLRHVPVAYQYFREDPALQLGTVAAPDAPSAVTKAIEFFQIEPAVQFRVVATKVAEAKKAAKVKT